jgi:hypothetical protein
MAAEKPRLNFLVVGAIGDGKSALIKSLLPDGYEGRKPDNSVSARGVTKDCCSYPIKNSNSYIVDTPGVGDQDAKLSDVVPMIEEYFMMTDNPKCVGGIHAILITCAVGQGRLTLGSKIAGEILKLSVFSNDETARNRVVVVGTKADKEDEEDREIWRQNVAPHFHDVLGGNPGHVCLTGCKFTAKGRGKNNLTELLQALQVIEDSVPPAMNYTQIDSTDIFTVLKDSAGLDITQQQLEQMASAMDSMRKAMEAQQEQYRQLRESFLEQQKNFQEQEAKRDKEFKEKVRNEAQARQREKQQFDSQMDKLKRQMRESCGKDQAKLAEANKVISDYEQSSWKNDPLLLICDAVPFLGTVTGLRRFF